MRNTVRNTLLGIAAIAMSACGSANKDSSTSKKPVGPSAWGEEYTSDIIGNLGEDLPRLPCDKFDVIVEEDDFGDPLVEIFCYIPEDEIQDALVTYADMCSIAGYEVTYDTQMGWDTDGFTRYYYDVYFADKVITPIKGIEMQFLEGNHKGKECLGIFAYNYTYAPEDAWPTNLVVDLLGHDLPHLEDNGKYRYDSHINSEGYIDIIIKNVAWDAEEEYTKLLEDNFYTVVPYGDLMDDADEYDYSEYGYYAFPPGLAEDIDHVIQFGQTNYGLEIYIYGREAMGA